MQFDSWAAALAMDGHGAYVWSVYLVALLVVIFLLQGPVLRSRRIMLERLGQLRRERASQEREVTLASDS